MISSPQVELEHVGIVKRLASGTFEAIAPELQDKAAVRQVQVHVGDSLASPWGE
jgi:hypothetical protein